MIILKGDLKKMVSDFMEKVDKKVLEKKLNHASELIKSGKQKDLISMLNSLDKNDIIEKVKEFEKLPPEDIAKLKEKLQQTVNFEDIENIQNNLDPESKKLLEKIITTFKSN